MPLAAYSIMRAMPKSDTKGVALAIDQDVGRLYIAVDDPLPVSVIEAEPTC